MTPGAAGLSGRPSLSVRAANGGDEHRFLLARGFEVVGRTRQFSVPALRPRQSAESVPMRWSGECDGYAVELYGDPRDAPDEVLVAWQDTLLATDSWPTERLPAPELRERWFPVDEWSAYEQPPLVAAYRADGSVAGAVRLDVPLGNDELEFEGGPRTPASPEAPVVTRALLTAARRSFPYCSFYCDLDDGTHGPMPAVMEAHGAGTKWDVVRLRDTAVRFPLSGPVAPPLPAPERGPESRCAHRG